MGKMKDEVCTDTPHDHWCPVSRCDTCECMCQMINEIRIDERMRMHNV